MKGSHWISHQPQRPDVERHPRAVVSALSGYEDDTRKSPPHCSRHCGMPTEPGHKPPDRDLRRSTSTRPPASEQRSRPWRQALSSWNGRSCRCSGQISLQLADLLLPDHKAGLVRIGASRGLRRRSPVVVDLRNCLFRLGAWRARRMASHDKLIWGDGPSRRLRGAGPRAGGRDKSCRASPNSGHDRSRRDHRSRRPDHIHDRVRHACKCVAAPERRAGFSDGASRAFRARPRHGRDAVAPAERRRRQGPSSARAGATAGDPEAACARGAIGARRPAACRKANDAGSVRQGPWLVDSKERRAEPGALISGL